MPFIPTSGAAYLRNNDEAFLINLDCTVENNVCTAFINVPMIAGNYSILWEVIRDIEKYKHETKLIILEI